MTEKTLKNGAAGTLPSSAENSGYLISREQDKINFRRGVLNGLFFMTFSSLMDPTLVLVTFVSILTDSPFLIGLIVPIREGMWYLPQIWMSGILQNQKQKIKAYRITAVIRMFSYAMIAVSINFISDPKLLLIFFFIFFTISSFVAGMGGLPFMEIVGKTVPARRRGEFFALRMGFGGLGSLICSFLVKWVLSDGGPFEFPQNFGFLAGLFFVGSSIGLLIYMFIKEPTQEEVLPRASMFPQLKRGLGLLKTDKSFRDFLIMQGSYMLSSAAVPFFAIYVQQDLGGNAAMVGIYLAFYTGTNLLANIFLGRASRKLGYKKIVQISITAGLFMLAAVLLLNIIAEPLNISPRVASLWLIPVFILSGIRLTGMGIGGMSLMYEIAPEKERSLYIGFTNSFIGVILLCTGVSGLIVNSFGFQILLIFSLLMNIAALYSARKISAGN